MGRRRKKILKLPKKTIPKIFLCPSCGEKSINVKIDRESATAEVKCSKCDIKMTVSIIPADQPVDAYCKFTDKFNAENVISE